MSDKNMEEQEGSQQHAEVEENGQDSDEELESQDEGAIASSEDSQQSGTTAGAKKKKKKNKKKKKKAAGAVENGTGDGKQDTQQPNTNQQQPEKKIDKAEAERRYNAALAAFRNDDLWVELSASNLQDSKAKKLIESLKKNTSVTSLDLSQNSLTNETAQAIASVLGTATVAPGLITLDLRENNFTEDGLNALAGLQKARRDLKVLTGAILPPEPPPSAISKAQANSKAMQDLSDSRLVRKYFQIGQEEEDDTVTASVPYPSIDPVELWQKLDAAVGQGTAGISDALPLLKTLVLQLANESKDYEPSTHGNIHIKACLEHLSTLESIMAINPPPVIVQYHPQPQAAVGSHRVFATEAVLELVKAHNKDIDQRLAPTKLVPRALHLAVCYPTCSALHARAVNLIKHAARSLVDDLLCPVLIVPGWGLNLPAPQATTEGRVHGQDPVEEGSQTQGVCEPLLQLLMKFARENIGVIPGLRNTKAGFVIHASKMLVQAAKGSENKSNNKDAQSTDDNPAEEEDKLPPINERVKAALMANAEWSEFTQAGGDLEKLVSEQEGDLGGPKPQKPPEQEVPDLNLSKLAGGHSWSGPEVLALLQGLSMQS